MRRHSLGCEGDQWWRGGWESGGRASQASLWKAEAVNLQDNREQPGAELPSIGREYSNLSSSLETSLIWWHLAVFKSLLGF